MSPQRIATAVRREVPLLRVNERLRDAVAQIVDADVPALPVVAESGRLCGIFGEREFIQALFPGYLGQIGYAGFVPRSLDESLEKRAVCLEEPVGAYMNTEHIDVGEDFSDTQLAEIFLHHRVLIIPILDAGRVSGIVSREAFFRALAARLLDVS